MPVTLPCCKRTVPDEFLNQDRVKTHGLNCRGCSMRYSAGDVENFPVPIPDPVVVGPTVHVASTDDLREAAENWIATNPQVYGLFERFALEMYARGKKFGVGLLTERVRWECAITSTSDDGFKINNNHRAYIGRKLVADHPQLQGLLSFRETRS
jgi:hypothetical protein